MNSILSLSELSDAPSADKYGFSPQLDAILARLPKYAGCRVRVANALCNAGILTVAALSRMKRGELRRWKNFGKRSLADLESTLAEFGLSLADTTPPIVVPDGSRPIDAHVEQLHRWIEEGLARCEARERQQNELDPARALERRLLTNVMLILDGRAPSASPDEDVFETQRPAGKARIHLLLQRPDGRRSEITRAPTVITLAMLEAAEDLLHTLTTGERPPPKGLYELCATAFGLPRNEVKERLVAAMYGQGKDAFDARKQGA